MSRPAVAENITVDGVMNASEGRFTPLGVEDVDQSYLHDALVP
jgi:hypothetical protein